MKSLSNIMMAVILLLSTTFAFAQIKNQKTETIKISGNCNMCKANIEEAGNLKNTASVIWDKDAKTATITYDQKKTTKDEILKRIALAGYDNERFLSPAAAYQKLEKCCQYDRVLKPGSTKNTDKNNKHAENSDHSKMELSQIQSLIGSYFDLKNALVKDDGSAASVKASELNKKLEAVNMEILTAQEHDIWMKVQKDLIFDASHIADTKDVGHQRDHFATLSGNIYLLARTQTPAQPIYYQHCPMFNKNKGANWLSESENIKNPYYGSMMLTCGSNQETIQ